MVKELLVLTHAFYNILGTIGKEIYDCFGVNHLLTTMDSHVHITGNSKIDRDNVPLPFEAQPDGAKIFVSIPLILFGVAINEYSFLTQSLPTTPSPSPYRAHTALQPSSQ